MTLNPQPARRTPAARLLRNRAALISGGLLAVIVIVSIAAPLLAPYDPEKAVLDWVLAPWSPEHPLGGDGGGRDIYSRLLYGGRVTLLAGMIATIVALAIGIPFGLIAGYFAGWFDSGISWIADVIMSIPAIVILFAVAPVFGNSLFSTMTVVGVLLSPGVYRLTRSAARNVARELYVDAARVSGLGDPRIIMRHVLPVIRGPLIVQSSLTFGVAVILQAGLDFVGLGDPTAVSWGTMLGAAFTSMTVAPSLVIAPGMAVGVTVAAVALFGSALADSLGIGHSRARRPTPHVGVRRSNDTSAHVEDVVPVEEPESLSPRRDDDRLEVVDLHVAYPTDDGAREVVRGVDITVRRGEVLGLIGESGSGKSQTSFAILGLLPPEAVASAKKLSLCGHNLLGLSDQQLRPLRGTRIAYVPQEPLSSLDPSFTIGAQLAGIMRAHSSRSRTQIIERSHELLERVGIPDVVAVMRKYPHQISGGMAQRVLIAAAISCDPEFLIADEPTTALDVTVQAEVLSLLRELQRERNLGLVLVSHNLGVVADICDNVAVMKEGTIVEHRPVRDLFSNPSHPYTRKLLSSTLDDSQPRSWPVSVR